MGLFAVALFEVALMPAIKTKNLSKKFKELVAVDSVSLEISEGELFGLLGPNGAGKTTFLSMLSTMLSPSNGSATVNGFEVTKQPNEVRKSIGIVFQDPSLDTQLTAYENLDLHGRLYGMQKDLRKERIEFVLKLVDLWGRRNSLVKTFSGGMKRRLEIARGLMHKPKVLFLDEPTLGLDPQTRRHIWAYIKKLNKEEKITMILTTHYLEEADFLCDRIAIIDFGKIVALDTAENLKRVVKGEILKVNSSNNRLLNEKLQSISINSIKEINGFLQLNVGEGEKLIPKIVLIADKSNVRVNSIELHKPTLDDVFIHFTGRKIREETLSNSAYYTDYLRRRNR